MGRLGAGKYPEPDLGEMLLGLPLISAIARPRQVRKLPRCKSGGGSVLCPYSRCRCRRATTAMPEFSEFRFAPRGSPIRYGHARGHRATWRLRVMGGWRRRVVVGPGC